MTQDRAAEIMAKLRESRLEGSAWKHQCCQVADAARVEGYLYALDKAETALTAAREEGERKWGDFQERLDGAFEDGSEEGRREGIEEALKVAEQFYPSASFMLQELRFLAAKDRPTSPKDET